jgi:Domain of unknown function (DUF4062)
VARPRIFISSTFFDLRQIREDLERFIKGLGYEPVRFESGQVPYSKDERLESSAYREIDLCDIFLTIVGSRFGSESKENQDYSITQSEVRRALERGIPVYIFVDSNVLSEYSTYQLNKASKHIKYRFVDDMRIYEFLESLYALPRNNPIAPFQTAPDITNYLLDQWAGLFQRFLQQKQRASEIQTLAEMNAVAATLRELVTFLTKEKQSSNEAMKNILLANHPAFRRLAKLTDTPYRVFFYNRQEMKQWLKGRGWSEVDPWDGDPKSVDEWHHKDLGTLKFNESIFDELEKLKVFTDDDWDDEWIERVEPPPADDDIPFLTHVIIEINVVTFATGLVCQIRYAPV